MTKDLSTSLSMCAVLLAASLLMAGCSTPHLMYQIQANDTLNADESGHSYSVIVRIYQLSGSETFLAATYNDLWRAESSLFGNELLAQHELTIEPGQSLRVSFPKQDNTRYTGVVAFFRERESNNWRSLRKVNNGPLPASTNLTLHVVNNDVQLGYAP